jgi:hypothetical protein
MGLDVSEAGLGGQGSLGWCRLVSASMSSSHISSVRYSCRQGSNYYY